MPDAPFTLQQKAFIMSLFRIEAPSVSASTPPVIFSPVTPTSMQTKVQAMMNDTNATASSRDDQWNYVEYRSFSKEYQKASVSKTFNTLRFDRYDDTTDPDKHIQYFMALIMIHNSSDAELCRFFPSYLRDSALYWLASLALRSISSFRELG